MGNRSAVLHALAGLSLLPVLALSPRATAAFTLRHPQVVFSAGALQSQLDAADGGIHVLTDQVENFSWIAPLLAKGCDVAFGIRSLDTTGTFTVGAYSTSQSSSTLCALLPAGATRGWFAACRISSSGILTVRLFDEVANFVGLTQFPGFDPAHTGFYVDGPGGIWFTEDARNEGSAQALSFGGTGINHGSVFLCFETWPYDPDDSTFTGVVLQVEAVCGLPARPSTWGHLKGLYR